MLGISLKDRDRNKYIRQRTEECHRRVPSEQTQMNFGPWVLSVYDEL